MSQFEFVLVIISIIIGLGLTELLSLLARILRGELRGGLLHGLWVAHVGVVLVQQFWSRWVMETRPDWTTGDITVFLLPALLAFLAAAVISPSTSAGDVSLDEYFVERRRPFFVVMILLMGAYALEDQVLQGGQLLWINGIRLSMSVLFLSAMLIPRRAIQFTCALVTTTFLVAFAYGWTSSLSFLSTLGGT